MIETVTWLELSLRLGLALLFGGIVGWNRELNKKPAGLRTHILVSVGSALFVLVAFEMVADVRAGSVGTNGGATTVVEADPIRVVQGLLQGVGFIGAGAIFRAKGEVEGVTTAASIWMTGALGLAAGSGNYVLGGVGAVLALVVLTVIGRIERKIVRRGGLSEGIRSEK